MIVGIGADLCDINRIEETLERFGERFVARCFTEIERRRSDRKAGRAASYAKRCRPRRPRPGPEFFLRSAVNSSPLTGH